MPGESVPGFTKKIRTTWDGYVVSGISYLMAGGFSLLCVIPFLYVVVYSLIPYSRYLSNPYSLIPAGASLSAYGQILASPYISTGYQMTLIVSAAGTALSMLVMVCTAYPLTKKDLKGRSILLTLWIITMFFNGGMIPNYILVRNLKLVNTPWALILPPLLGAYNLILMKNYMSSLPESLEEAARIDGANDIRILFQVVLPLCLPILATLSLFTIVYYWNTYFNAILYMTKRVNWPLQLVLRELVVEGSTTELGQVIDDGQRLAQPFTLKMAAILVTTLPIMCVYPFLQRFFMSGLTLGGVKE